MTTEKAARGSKIEIKQDNKNKVYAIVVTAIGGLAVGGGLTMQNFNNEPDPGWNMSPALMHAAEVIGLDQDTAELLLEAQDANTRGGDVDPGVESPLDKLRVLGMNDFTIEQGQGIIAGATNEYVEQSGPGEIPESVSQSIRFTTESVQEQLRATGESANPQPGDKFSLVTFLDDEGKPLAVVSLPMKTDPN